MSGTLYLVATPIGNLSDMSSRAIETLRSVDLIACEDTRHTRKLLTHFDISNKLVSYHEHNETERATEIVKLLSDGKSVAIVSDAGTPGISDPSFVVVQLAREVGFPVVSIPGPVAFVNAVVASGLPTDSIFFASFLPSRVGDRRRRLEEVRNIPATLVFYESPHRLVKSLGDCLAVLGDRKAAIARELTKLHEEIIGGTLSQLVEKLSSASLKGEFVVVIDRTGDEADRKSTERPDLITRYLELEAEGLDHKAALKRAAKEFGIGKSEAYRIIQSERK
ncbi:MAG TPA: 16S rRNA (cytidine(1402)-2'-O)-methyltransferase [Pyrinomonadaceae bacterium]|nr:16S rRNA (cytidine(1402)-2'-O)-methyltransferase [Pyrinomonadaceae bacterium]